MTESLKEAVAHICNQLTFENGACVSSRPAIELAIEKVIAPALQRAETAERERESTRANLASQAFAADAETTRLKALLGEVEEALEPLGAIVERMELAYPNSPDDRALDRFCGYVVQFAWLRQIRALLSTLRNSGDGE